MSPWCRISGAPAAKEIRPGFWINNPKAVCRGDGPLELVDNPPLTVGASGHVKHEHQYYGADETKAVDKIGVVILQHLGIGTDLVGNGNPGEETDRGAGSSPHKKAPNGNAKNAWLSQSGPNKLIFA
jgi:hypothetical protein